MVDRSSRRIYSLPAPLPTLHNGDESMAIETSWDNRVLIVRTGERLDGVNAQAFIDRMGSAAGGAAQGVVIDMERLVHISHAGLRVVLQVVRCMEREDARLALCALSPDAMGAFHASGLADLVDIYSSRTEAIAAVGG